MALINQEELNAIARLSALSLTDEERIIFTEELNVIIEYASSLQHIAAQLPQQGSAERPYLLREDTVVISDSNVILTQAPQKQDRYFAVPPILE